MANKTVNVTKNQTETVNVPSIEEKTVKNVTFNCFKAASCFKGRSNVLKQIEECFKSNRIIAIHGEPGIGKSETARQFSIQNSDYFKGNIIWMFAETQEKLEECFKRLSETLGLYFIDDVCVSQVYSKLSNSLFIFENMENMTAISKYLPCNQLHPTIKVLITSQSSPLDSSVAIVSLKALDVEDALQILEHKLSDKYLKHPIEVWKDLVEYLEGIPLSIQAVAALLKQELDKTIRITEFHLESFFSNLKNLVSAKIPDSEMMNYNKSAFNSIWFSLGRLEEQNTSQPLDLLRYMAYLDADHIFHFDLLSVPSISNCKERLEAALNKLVQYSLIQVEEVVKDVLKIKVHRTIQLVARKFDLNERNGTIFKILMKTMVSSYKIQNQLYTKKIGGVFHFQSFYKYVKEEEYKNNSLEFYNENEDLADSFLCALASFHCHELLQELFKDEHIKTGNSNEILNKMLLRALANENNNLLTINLLIKYGAKIDLIPNKSNGFHFASTWLSLELFDRLLKSNNAKEIINSEDSMGRTILHLLVEKCNEENIEKTMECMDHLIFKWNADIFIRAEYSFTILHTACSNLNYLLSLEFFKYLVEKHNLKCLINTQCKSGKTPLQYFIVKNYICEWKHNVFEIFSYSINDCGADVSIQDNDKWNTLFYVCSNGTREMIDFVFKTKNCQDLINIQDSSLGNVAFIQLIDNKFINETDIIELMKLFVKNNMDFNIRNMYNRTLVELVEMKKLRELSTEIKNHLEKENLKAESTSEKEEKNLNPIPQ